MSGWMALGVGVRGGGSDSLRAGSLRRVGAGGLFAATVVCAWILMLVFLRLEDAWDAGYLFMLVALGIAVAVGLGQEGLGAIFPR